MNTHIRSKRVLQKNLSLKNSLLNDNSNKNIFKVINKKEKQTHNQRDLYYNWKTFF